MPSMSYDETPEEFGVAEKEYHAEQVMEVEATASSYTPLEISSPLHDGDRKFFDENVEHGN